MHKIVSSIKQTMRCFLLMLLALSTSMVQAIEISSMFVIADEQGRGKFTINNTQSKRLFMNVGMSEIKVDGDGEIVKVPYTRDNLPDWKIDVHPARTIIGIDYIKDFSVSMKCGADCVKEQDQVFQLAFVPTPYLEQGQEQSAVVQMAIGFGALFMYPADDQPIVYRASYDGQQVVIENRGNSYLKARLTTCEPDVSVAERDQCSEFINVLSGRKLTVTLPENMRKLHVDLYLNTNRDRYSESVRLTR